MSNSLFNSDTKLVSIKEASRRVSRLLDRTISVSNISYLVQYGRIRKHNNGGSTLVDIDELMDYYKKFNQEGQWKKLLGDDLNWHLSFVEYRESERTKHVHRLHPYKGKFIPQLVEYFLDDHTDEFKKEAYFQKGDLVLDPFCGSGTTLVQANELGLHGIGIDVSAFNAMISNVKLEKHNFSLIAEEFKRLTRKLEAFEETSTARKFEKTLLDQLSLFNNLFFPSPEYKRKVHSGDINEKEYGEEKETAFLKIYTSLVERYRIKITQDDDSAFLGKWFLAPVREEIDFLFKDINSLENIEVKKVLGVVLSRTVRSCRATTHADLGTLKDPISTTYYCKKHGKICKPIFSILGWWKTYTKDTIKRLEIFNKIRTDTYQICLTGDSRTIDINKELELKHPLLAEKLSSQKIKGIFTSPPYVGLIDYHEQHAYAYEIFGFERRDAHEIGPLYKGYGREARESYARGVADVLLNCKKYLQHDYDVFMVANDKYNLYPQIAEMAGMKIVNTFKRPVLNRVEKDRSAYAEIIFHLKEA